MVCVCGECDMYVCWYVLYVVCVMCEVCVVCVYISVSYVYVYYRKMFIYLIFTVYPVLFSALSIY